MALGKKKKKKRCSPSMEYGGPKPLHRPLNTPPQNPHPAFERLQLPYTEKTFAELRLEANAALTNRQRAAGSFGPDF